MSKKPLSYILFLALFFSPIQSVFAQEVASSDPLQNIPENTKEIFITDTSNGRVVVASKITEDLALVCSFSEQSIKEIESTQTTQETIPCVVWSLNGGQVSSLENNGAGVVQSDFTNYEHDTDTGLEYAKARYYHSSKGQFISQDPVFWEVGQTEDGKKVLTNPQAQNSYLYANGNPIVNKDPEGRIADTLLDIGFIAYDTYKLTDAMLNGGNVKQELKALGLDIGGALIPGVTGLGLGVRAVDKTNDTIKVVTEISKVAETTKDIKKIHGNSLNYPGLSTGYTLRDNVTNEILKFGETIKSDPTNRYSKNFYRETNSYLKPEMKGSKVDTHTWQNSKIIEYKSQNQGKRPSLNKSNW